jgi:hypothetical protein
MEADAAGTASASGGARKGRNKTEEYHPGPTGVFDLAARTKGATVFQISIYRITPILWRWEIRCAGALLRCGTASTRIAAERHADEIVNT